MNRPFVFINVAMTADGKIDTFERKGAAISSPGDKARVDQLRAGADAIMVGGRTLLDEDPKLTVKSEELRAERVASGRPPNPIKVGIVTVANIKPDSQFLNAGPADIVIFTTQRTSKRHLALVTSRHVDVYVDQAAKVDLPGALAILKEIGVERLMVEGGSRLNFELLRLGLVDEIIAYVAPLIFGGEVGSYSGSGSRLKQRQSYSIEIGRRRNRGGWRRVVKISCSEVTMNTTMHQKFEVLLEQEGDHECEGLGRDKICVRIVAMAELPTRFGDFHIVAFENNRDGKEHVAITRGDVIGASDVPVRLHSECLTGDVMGSLRCDCRDQLEVRAEKDRTHGKGHGALSATGGARHRSDQ